MYTSAAMHWPVKADTMHGCWHSRLCSRHSFAGHRHLLVTRHRQRAVLDTVVRHAVCCKQHLFIAKANQFAMQACCVKQECEHCNPQGRKEEEGRRWAEGRHRRRRRRRLVEWAYQAFWEGQGGVRARRGSVLYQVFIVVGTDKHYRRCRAAYKEETRSIILSLDKVSKTAPNGKPILNKVGLGMYLGAKIGILGVNGARLPPPTCPPLSPL